MKKFDYYQPRSLQEAYGWMEKEKGDARYIAGGTDIIWRVKQGMIEADALISLRGIEELTQVRLNGDLTIGSMVPFRNIERNASLAKAYPSLSEAVSLLANPQVRNVATVGGNLCNAAPSADCAPPLIVLDAVLTLEGPGGKREVPIGGFFKGPGETCMEKTEILTQIRVPKMAANSGTSFLKKGRVSQDIAMVNAAAFLVMEGSVCQKCRLAVGAVAPVPLRLTDVEAMVENQEVSTELLERVAEKAEQAVRPITDVRSTAEYRRVLSGVLVKKAIREAHQRAVHQ